jgi:CheY-like chemotaxis protein
MSLQRESGIRGLSVARRVLVVDDDADSADLVVLTLQRAGHEARAVGTARAALATAAEFLPQVVVLDLGLPDMSGYELGVSLKGDPALASCELIALTGRAERDDRLKTMAAGFKAHITKPFSLEALLTAVSDGTSTPAAAFAH